ncbi:hypothetical protein ACQJBY_059724 [Aegilops geniculata]
MVMNLCDVNCVPHLLIHRQFLIYWITLKVHSIDGDMIRLKIYFFYTEVNYTWFAASIRDGVMNIDESSKKKNIDEIYAEIAFGDRAHWRPPDSRFKFHRNSYFYISKDSDFFYKYT